VLGEVPNDRLALRFDGDDLIQSSRFGGELRRSRRLIFPARSRTTTGRRIDFERLADAIKKLPSSDGALLSQSLDAQQYERFFFDHPGPTGQT
jgi:hypothetical protein